MKKLFIIIILFISANFLFAQKIIKIVNDYVLIDTDKNIGELNEEIYVYRNDNLIIGKIVIVKFSLRRTAGKILGVRENYKIRIGDYVKVKKIKKEITPFSYYTLGYSVNIPSQLFGANLYQLTNKMGFYIAFRTGGFHFSRNHSDYYDNISQEQVDSWGDDLIGKDKGSITIDIGLTHYVIHLFHVYFGAGYTSIRSYKEYDDPADILGTDREYWIQNTDALVSKIDVFGGLIFTVANTFTVHIGYVTIPSGVNIGISYILPKF